MVRTLLEKVPVAVATNCSVALASTAVAALGVSIPAVVTAEEAEGRAEKDTCPVPFSAPRYAT